MIDLKVSDIRTFVPASDFGVSKAFYSALGFGIKWSDANMALLEIANQRFYLQRYYVKEWADNSMLHITVESASDWHAHVVAALESGSFGDARVRAPARQPYGATVVFVHDPAGVLIHLCQWDR